MSLSPKKLSIREMWDIYLESLKDVPDVPRTVKIMYPKAKSIPVEEYMSKYVVGLYASGYPEFLDFIKVFKNVS